MNVAHMMNTVSTVDTDGLVLKHQGINSQSADDACRRLSVFKGYVACSLGRTRVCWNFLYFYNKSLIQHKQDGPWTHNEHSDATRNQTPYHHSV